MVKGCLQPRDLWFNDILCVLLYVCEELQFSRVFSWNHAFCDVHSNPQIIQLSTIAILYYWNYHSM